MIGRLPTKLNISGTDRAIRSDFRVALLIMQAYNDSELSDQEKARTMMECLYEDYKEVSLDGYQEAYNQAVWFLDGGDNTSNKESSKKLMDWEQDEQLVFSAVNKVAGYETRTVEYIHWWTFLGYMREMGECLFNTVVSIRNKKNKKKKLEKYEEEFYRENKSLIDIKVKLTPEEQAEKEYYEKLLG